MVYLYEKFWDHFSELQFFSQAGFIAMTKTGDMQAKGNILGQTYLS